VPFGWALQECEGRQLPYLRKHPRGTRDSDASRATPVSEKNENFRQPVDSNEENIGQEQTEKQHYEESILCVKDVKSKQLYKSRLLSLPREILRFIWQLLALHDIKQVRLTESSELSLQFNTTHRAQSRVEAAYKSRIAGWSSTRSQTGCRVGSQASQERRLHSHDVPRDQRRV
jgi:hypothetical protein